MYKKIVFISSMLFICLISISFVCATDNTIDESILTIDDSSDEEIIGDASNEESVSDSSEGNFTELSNLISDADGSIDLDKNYTRLSGDSVANTGIVINKSLTINGNGHAIDAKELGRIFSVSGANVVLKNITFVNARYSGSGGAIYSSGVNLTLEDCRFEDNYANYGGAVYTTGSNTKVSDCEFSNNTGYYSGGAISSSGSNLIVEDSTFTGNRNIQTGLYTSYSGGAIYSTGSYANISNSQFDKNHAAIGGAVYTSGTRSNITNSTFVNNTAEDGAAVFCYGSYSTIKDSKFYNNTVDTLNGGAVDMYGSYENLIGSSFENNSAAGSGGGVYWYGDYGKLSNSTFVNNSAATEGGGVYSYSHSASLTDSRFENNSAVYHGGGVYWRYYSGKLNNLTFIGNNASNGGGLSVIGSLDDDGSNSNTVVSNSTFINNTARYGGAGADISAHTKIVNSSFENNSALNYGGALGLTNAEADNCNFTNNTATFGGAVYTYNSTIKNSTFDGNKATDGNSVYILDKTTLSDNKNLQDEDVYLYDSGKDRGYVVDNDYGIDDLITTSDDYFAYCAQRYNTNPYDGVYDNRMVLLKNSINGQPVGEYLKILIYEYLDKFQDMKDYDFAEYVWTFTDGEYWNSDDPIVQEVMRIYDSGFRVPTEKACKVLSNGTLMYFNFSSLITPTGQQNLFLFKFDYGDLINETFSKETLNETILVNQTVDFRIVVSNKGQSAIYDIFVEDNDYSNGLKYESWRSENGDWTYDEASKKWRLEELLPAKSASFIVTFRATSNGTFYNNATDGVGIKEINESNATVTVYNPSLSVEKISLNPIVEIGNKTVFEIIVRNTGDMELSDVFVIEDEYSDGLVYLGFESIDGEWMHSLNEDSKHVFTLAEKLGVGENRSFYVIFNATKEGVLTNTVVAGYENNTLANSTNVTNVTSNDVENETQNDTNKTQNKTHDVKTKTVMKTVKNDDKATGNPLFALLLTLIAIPIAKRFEK